jgi:hypothetical protein
MSGIGLAAKLFDKKKPASAVQPRPDLSGQTSTGSLIGSRTGRAIY